MAECDARNGDSSSKPARFPVSTCAVAATPSIVIGICGIVPSKRNGIATAPGSAVGSAGGIASVSFAPA